MHATPGVSIERARLGRVHEKAFRRLGGVTRTIVLDNLREGVLAGAKAVYTYDFGDSWEHQVVVEKRLAPEPGHAYPACLAGERHGPPEDCGGIPGFYNLLEAIRDPEHEEHEELLDWVGGSFDPDAFSVDEVNRRFAPRQRRRKAAGGRK